jgi:pyruvate,water dikinase
VVSKELAPQDLIQAIEQLAVAAGDYFASITLVAGFGWKAELPLAIFYRQHLAPRVGGNHQALLSGLADLSLAAPPHGVEDLDWIHPTLGELEPRSTAATDRVAEVRQTQARTARRSAEAAARAVLAHEPKRLARFDKLLAVAQRFARIREEQVASFTLGWPTMRQAVLQLGTLLVQHGAVLSSEDVFFLTHDELVAALAADEPPPNLAQMVADRRRQWQRQRQLTPPLVLGEMSPMVSRIFETVEGGFRSGAGPPPALGLGGLPASPGSATGPVRVLRDLAESERLQAGDVLVVSAMTPAWAPLFGRASAVVTDTGSPAAHASLVAREYGIPAVVGTGDATSRLRDGQVVRVDGGTGHVELQP